MFVLETSSAIRNRRDKHFACGLTIDRLTVHGRPRIERSRFKQVGF